MSFKPNSNVIFFQSLRDAFASVAMPFPKRTPHPGRFVRFPTNDKQIGDAGWCRLYPDGTGAVFGDFRHGTSYVWQQRDLTAPPPTDEERQAASVKADAARHKADAERAAEQAKAKQTASRLWAESVALQATHPYVAQKGITPLMARQSSDGKIVIPVYGPDDELQTLQFIDASSNKRFLPKGKAKSGRLILGDIRADQPLIVCEGWATGCSLHEATGYAIVVCFGGGNLAPVAKGLRGKHPDVQIVIAGDLDESGAGAGFADAALKEVRDAVVVFPVFADNRAKGDFNDLHQADGLEVVEVQINAKRWTASVQISNLTTVSPVAVPTLPGFDVRNGTATTHPLTDFGNALRMFDLVGEKLKYVFDDDKWLVWDSTAWTWDPDGSTVHTLVSDKLPSMLVREAAAYPSHAFEFMTWFRRCQQWSTVKNSVSLFKNLSQVRLSLASLDADEMLIGFDNARQVVDLRTGVARTATPDDIVTKSMHVAALGDADNATRWTQFLNEVFDNDLELIDWFQRFCGYLLTSSTQEQIFLFLHGSGANGKSVLVETLKRIMGDYAKTVAPETLCSVNRAGGAATPDLIPMIGARMVLSSEAEENSKFAQSRIKSLVAGDSMVARANYGSPIEFTPMMKLIITGNHLPDYSGNDGGLERRLRIIPFKKTFSAQERDPQLMVTLMQEQAHIFAWMVNGCLKWRRRDLADVPRAILEASAVYKEDQDTLGQWLADCTEQSSASMNSMDAYDSYKAWSQDNGIQPATKRKFIGGLRDRCYETRKSNNKTLVCGLSLTDFRRRSPNITPEGRPVYSSAQPV